ncbi:uncharacterized protein LOC143911406 [Arctopsyche grandis]|uniref:uncharacterized protein LOC143911406 n=1 Tax=Arctopsyche grandis TaxID=121162 RepID=UPI00406D9A99
MFTVEIQKVWLAVLLVISEIMDSNDIRKNISNLVAENESLIKDSILDYGGLENMHFKLNSVQKMLENKEDTLNVLEDSLNYTRNQLKELTRCFNILQCDRDAKAIEIANLQRAVDFHTNTINELQREKLENHSDGISDDLFFQRFEDESKLLLTKKYEDEIKSLKFDLGVMENLYKNCHEEMMSQEKTIDNLRQSCLDYSLREFNLQIDNQMLLTKIKSNTNISPNQCNNKKKSLLIDVKDEVSDILLNLNSLKEILLNETLKEKDDAVEELKNENIKLKSEVSMLQTELQKSKNNKLFKKPERKFWIKNIQQTLNEIKMNIKNTKGLLKKNCSRIQSQILPNIQKKLSDYKNENIMLKKETNLQKMNLLDFEEICSRNNETILELNDTLRTTQESLKNLNENYKNKTECIAWLELQLSESTAKGSELCNKSHLIFECVQKLLQQVKKKKLQNVLKMLSLNEDFTNYTFKN